MGVTIHYKGRLNDVALFSSLCDEVDDIARAMGWAVTTLDDDWSIPPNATLMKGGRIEGHLGLRGIQISPHPESESLALFFDREGNLRAPINMIMILDGTLQPDAAWITMKTQFAGPDTHVWVVGLLKYLKKRYMTDLDVSDESGYWDTGDRQKLEENMALLNGKLQHLSTTISAGRMGDLTGLSADEIASRIERFFLNGKAVEGEC